MWVVLAIAIGAGTPCRLAGAEGPILPATTNSPAEWSEARQVSPRSPTASHPPIDTSHSSPAGWLRIAQQPPAADSEPASGDQNETSPAITESDARTEQQAAVLKLIASNQEAAENRREEFEKEQADWEAKLHQLATDGLDERAPYSYPSLDKARDELAAETQNADTLRDAVTAAKEALAKAAAEQTDKQRAVRRAKEELENSNDPGAIATLTSAVAEAERALKVADEQVELRRLESANVQLEQQVQTLRHAYAQKKVDLYELDVVFTQGMLDEVLRGLDRRINAASNDLKRLEYDLTYQQNQWYQARQRLDEARGSQDDSQLATLQAEVQHRDLAQQAAQFESELLVDRKDHLSDLKETWNRRFDLANPTISSADTGTWVGETETALDRLRRTAANLNAKLEGIPSQLTSLEKKRQDADEADTSVHRWLDESLESLESQRRMCERTLAEVEATRQVHRKLLHDLTDGSLTDTASRWLAEAGELVRSVWDQPLATVGNRDITVGRIVNGLILLLIGVYASRFISRLFGRRLLKRMGVNASATAALQSVAFYLLVLIFTLFALKLIEVPLTAFTVLGGALALGVGFGSQNIVNNFISGLVLLAERPVKVGDLIQLDDIYGNVEHIGPRSTRVKTGENLDIIVPNSTFLETNVINWTLSDHHMRSKVVFGVAYGSPTGKVSLAALKAAANHDRVFERPAPFVIFADFGDSALVFELHFWMAVRTLMERRRIESDIRFNIDHLFREADITIAFPQRDLHLFTEEPIRVQMASPPSDPAGA